MSPDQFKLDVLGILGEHPLFEALPQKDLARLIEMASSIQLDPGDVLMEEGTPGGSLYLLLEGEFVVTKRSGQQDVQIAVRGPGEVFGEISILDRAPRSATLTATKPSSLLELDQQAFQDVIESSPPAALALLSTITSRLRNTEAMLRQHEKMAALGTLAAGLAHELNNPAAAIGRGADQLRETLNKWLKASAEVGVIPLTAAEQTAIQAFEQRMLEPSSVEEVDPLSRSDLEDQLTDWLQAKGVDDGWEYAPWLVSGGWSQPELESMVVDVAPEHLERILRWFAIGVSLFSLAGEIHEGAGRISNLVGSFKTYAYLDQAPAQLVDVHKGLEDTLAILRGKTGPGIHIDRQYAPDLPRIEAYGSELNQVWTNLIDNALDAVGETGSLVLRTERRSAKVVVSICDSGPGIPDDIRERVFEPFFTTKAPGVGTGLGLHIVYNIVCQRHGGSVWIEGDEAGMNCIVVELPIESPPRPKSPEPDQSSA
ncbi:MAG: ATP-binding protein [Anaerolineales bacterium]